LIDNKIWIQQDETEDGIASDLLEAGVPKEDIVLGFRPHNCGNIMALPLSNRRE
jgi:hypothetical protein